MLTDRGMLKWGIRPSRPVAFSGSEGRVPDRSIADTEVIGEMRNERDSEMDCESQKNGWKRPVFIPQNISMSHYRQKKSPPTSRLDSDDLTLFKEPMFEFDFTPRLLVSTRNVTRSSSSRVSEDPQPRIDR